VNNLIHNKTKTDLSIAVLDI